MLPATFRINRHESPQQYLCNFQCQAGKPIIMRSFIAGPRAPLKALDFTWSDACYSSRSTEIGCFNF